MARPKKVMEENAPELDIAIEEMEPQMVEVPKKDEIDEEIESNRKKDMNRLSLQEKQLVNCLSNTRICVRYILKEDGKITNPKHVLYGGMAENAKITYVVPKLSSGVYVNVLTDAEKDYLEYALGLEPNALSVYNRKNNFWSTATEGSIAFVELKKQDNYFYLNDPVQYIKYKILLANKEYIAPSLEALQNSPKATYRFVIINEGEEAKASKSRMSYTMQCYKEFGKVENNPDMLRFILFAATSVKSVPTTPLEILQVKVNDLIQADAKAFLRIISDPLRDTKVLIIRAAEEGLISKRANFYYMKSGNETIPMCENGEEPTLSIAARWLSHPRRQEMKFNLEDRLNK